MLLKEFIAGAVPALEPLYGQSEARSIVLNLCEDILGTRSYTHIVEPDFAVPEGRLPVLKENLARLAEAEPLQYVVGHAPFCGYDFKVTPDVLIPRQETELLCRSAIDFASRISRMRVAAGRYAAPVRILDLCTGSGCIAWTLALSVPGSEVTGTDISEKALEVARSQDFKSYVKAHNIKVPRFVLHDILSAGADGAFDAGTDDVPDASGAGEAGFDLILSNPPYVRESEKSSMNKNVLDYEPASALFVPDDDPLLYYRAIAAFSMKHLNPDGAGFVEINEAFGTQVSETFVSAGFQRTELTKDLNNRNRILHYWR